MELENYTLEIGKDPRKPGNGCIYYLIALWIIIPLSTYLILRYGN